MDFIYVTDVARAYILAAAADATDVVMNAGTGIETSLRELCMALCGEAGQPGVAPVFEPARAVNGVTRRRAATDLAKETIGFEAKVSLEDGLKDLVRWHRAVKRPAAAGTAP
jgi:UDP-glucose 4-epimerase